MSLMIRVGREPERYSSDATYFDGETAAPRRVHVTVDETAQALVALEGDEPLFTWKLEEIREPADQAGSDLLVLRLRDDALRRIILPDRDLLPRLPHRTRRAPVARRGRLALWALAAIASVALIIFVLMPRMADQLARFIPPEGERALGEVTLDQIRSALDRTGLEPVPFCTNPAGQAALATMENRLEAALPEGRTLSVHVLDHEMVNAFALPGNYIVFFRGLIENAGTPEEVAAVFAHEIGHVVSRDPTRHALRSAGSIGVLGLIFGDFAGGALVLFLAERLIEASYSQEAEAAADLFAHRVLAEAQIAPSALADMFERFRAMGGEADGFVSHFMSHPALGDRIEAARQATPEGFEPKPILDAAAWRDLQNICD